MMPGTLALRVERGFVDGAIQRNDLRRLPAAKTVLDISSGMSIRSGTLKGEELPA
jgi:hypothetical protein